MKRLLITVFAAVALLAAPPVSAVEPDEILDDPALETRARALSEEIRCVVCQNESIDSSNADLARDLRILVRERLVAGDSDQEVLDYLVARYGDFVLLRPPFKPSTYLLWFGPFLLLILGLALVAFYFRGRGAQAPAAVAPLSDAEKARLEALIDSAEPGGDARKDGP